MLTSLSDTEGKAMRIYEVKRVIYVILFNRYDIALGTTAGGTQLKNFFSVPSDTTKVLITNLDLTDVRKVKWYKMYSIA